MTDAVRAMFRAQAAGCEGLGSPLTARVLRLLAAAMTPGHAIEDRVLLWQGDLSRAGDALALRLAAGLHALVLSGTAPELIGFYHAPETVSDAEATALLLRVLRAHPTDLHLWLDHPPQTNEIRRSAVLIAAGHWLMARVGLPMVLSELGASAGLNLLWDRYGLEIGAQYGPKDAPIRLAPAWRGDLPPVAVPQIVARAGVDLCPRDPLRDRTRALSYIWADQTERLLRTAAGLDALAAFGPVVDQADAIECWRSDWPRHTPRICIWFTTPLLGSIFQPLQSCAVWLCLTLRAREQRPRPRWRIWQWRPTRKSMVRL